MARTAATIESVWSKLNKGTPANRETRRSAGEKLSETQAPRTPEVFLLVCLLPTVTRGSCQHLGRSQGGGSAPQKLKKVDSRIARIPQLSRGFAVRLNRLTWNGFNALRRHTWLAAIMVVLHLHLDEGAGETDSAHGRTSFRPPHLPRGYVTTTCPAQNMQGGVGRSRLPEYRAHPFFCC